MRTVPKVVRDCECEKCKYYTPHEEYAQNCCSYGCSEEDFNQEMPCVKR